MRSRALNVVRALFPLPTAFERLSSLRAPLSLRELLTFLFCRFRFAGLFPLESGGSSYGPRRGQTFPSAFQRLFPSRHVPNGVYPVRTS